MMFRQRLWMIPVAHWTGLAAAASCVWLVMHNTPAWWLLAWVVGHIVGGISVSVGLHRYFTHAAFQTSRFWHNALAFYSTLTVQGSALGWAAAHMTHHVHSDKDGDPHYTGISYLWFKQYNKVRMVTWRVKHLVSDPVLAFTHRYGVLLILGWIAFLLCVGYLTGTGVKPLLFCYLAPLGSSHMAGAVHQVNSHRGGNGARNMPYMEWLLPAAGEWMHKHHHEHPRDPKIGQKWWHLDYGYAFIRAVRTDAK